MKTSIFILAACLFAAVGCGDAVTSRAPDVGGPGDDVLVSADGQSTSDAGTTDQESGADTASPVVEDIVGTWYDCIGTLTLEEGGTFTYHGLDDACTTHGTWVFEEFVLDFEVLDTTCPESPTDRQTDWIHTGILVIPTSKEMAWSHPALDGGFKAWMRGGAYVAARWVVEDPDLGNGQDLRVCFSESGHFVQGYYFQPEGQEGLLSGSGRVERVEPVAGRIDSVQVRTSCQGSCMCAGLLELSFSDSDESIDGTWKALNCAELLGAGTLIGDVVAWDGYLG